LPEPKLITLPVSVCYGVFESWGSQQMSGYRFGIGERVSYSEKRFPMGVWTAELMVVEQLARGAEPKYRLMDQEGASEYVLAEHELSPSSGNYHYGRGQPTPWSA
jgi:hypothetical protein